MENETAQVLYFFSFFFFFFFRFWPGLGLPRPKAIVVIPKNQPLPKYLREKTSKSAKYHRPLRYEKKTG